MDHERPTTDELLALALSKSELTDERSKKDAHRIQARDDREGSSAMMKLLYRPFGLASSVLGGVVAGMLFKQVWKRIAREEDAPKAVDERRGWREVIAAAAVQGAVFGTVKAVIDRGGAHGFRRITGVWPG
jgi:hypothetical protein